MVVLCSPDPSFIFFQTWSFSYSSKHGIFFRSVNCFFKSSCHELLRLQLTSIPEIMVSSLKSWFLPNQTRSTIACNALGVAAKARHWSGRVPWVCVKTRDLNLKLNFYSHDCNGNMYIMDGKLMEFADCFGIRGSLFFQTHLHEDVKICFSMIGNEVPVSVRTHIFIILARCFHNQIPYVTWTCLVEI